MRPTLRQEIEGFLRLHGPATATAIAMGVRARRVDADSLLSSDDFRVVPAPEGSSPRACYFDLSERVPRRRKANTRRARQLLSVLSDGRAHSREEIFRAVGKFFLTNNAAAELRAQGFDVRHERRDGVDVYWLVSAGSLDAAPPSVTPPPSPEGGAASSETGLFELPGRGAYGDAA